MPRATLKRKRAFEGVDYPRRPRLTRSIDAIIDDSIRADEDLFAGPISMTREAPREQSDTGQLLDPLRSRRIFDKSALREQMLKNKNKRIATTTESPSGVASVPVGAGRFKMQTDFKEFIIEMEEANQAWLGYLQFVRNERPIDTRANLDVTNFPPFVTIVFLQKHPWRTQMVEFLSWFYKTSEPGEIRQNYEEFFQLLVEKLIKASDFNKKYMEKSFEFALGIASLLEDYDTIQGNQEPSVLQPDSSWDDIVAVPFGEEENQTDDLESAASYWEKQETKMRGDDSDILDLLSDIIEEKDEEEEGEDESDLEPEALEELILGQDLSVIVSFFYDNGLAMNKETERKLIQRKGSFTSEEVKDAAEALTTLMFLSNMDADYISQTQEDSLKSFVRFVNNLQNHTVYDPVKAAETHTVVQEMLETYDKWKDTHAIVSEEEEDEEEEAAIVHDSINLKLGELVKRYFNNAVSLGANEPDQITTRRAGFTDVEIQDAAAKLNAVILMFDGQPMNSQQYNSLVSLVEMVLDTADWHSSVLSDETKAEMDRLKYNYQHANIAKAKYPPMPNAIP